MIKRLTISTLQQQEEDNHKFWASLSPAQRLATVFEMHKKMYGESIVHAKKLRSNRIIFT